MTSTIEFLQTTTERFKTKLNLVTINGYPKLGAKESEKHALNLYSFSATVLEAVAVVSADFRFWFYYFCYIFYIFFTFWYVKFDNRLSYQILVEVFIIFYFNNLWMFLCIMYFRNVYKYINKNIILLPLKFFGFYQNI